MFAIRRGRIVLSYALLLFDFCAAAALPFLLGKAADGLTNNDNSAFLGYLAAAGTSVVISFGRKRFDNRTFLLVWRDRAVHAITALMRRKVSPTSIISRSHMVKEYARFLEETVPASVSCAVNILVAIGVLWFQVGAPAYWVVAAALLAMATQYALAGLTQRVEDQAQGQREGIYKQVGVGNQCEVGIGYERQRAIYVRLADLESTAGGATDLIKVLTVAAVLVALTAAGCSAGSVVANIVYTANVFTGVGSLGASLRHWRQLKVYDDFLQRD